MNESLTLEKVREITELMRKQAIPPRVVKSRKEAREMTRNDPCGHKWMVGEEYYKCETLRQTMPLRASTAETEL